jgi:hypothetical protein
MPRRKGPRDHLVGRRSLSEQLSGIQMGLRQQAAQGVIMLFDRAIP